MELLRSAVLRVPHGFPTRLGGVSEGPYASLNCAFTVGDEPGHVEQNLERLARAAGVPQGRLLSVQQVHGDVVLEVPLAAGDTATPDDFPQLGVADALVSAQEGTAIGVRTADCAPVLLEDPDGHQVAAVHAGWRGVIAEILPKAVEALCRRGARPASLRAAVGPCIQRCCFEVDEDLGARFERRFGSTVLVREPGRRPRVDLPGALAVQLEALGISSDRRELFRACTHCDGRFFSHRRDRGVTGRHFSFITHRFATRL